MKYSLRIVLFIFLFTPTLQSYSQGCSDAGVCTVGSLGTVQFKYEVLPVSETKLLPVATQDPELNLNPIVDKNNKNDSTEQTFATTTTIDSLPTNKKETLRYTFQYPKYFFQLNASYGLGDRNTSIIIAQLDANVRLNKKGMYAQVKVPYSIINGNLGSVSGIGDITASITGVAFANRTSSLSLTGGIKFPVNNANILKDTLPLPMVYQTSLGTTDILLGAKYAYKKWDFTIGYQHAFNANKNGYLHRSGISDSSNYNSYFESNNLKRADDGVFRINRNFISKKINAGAGLLFIYHLADDTYINSLGERKKIAGSQGLTLNINISGLVPISKKLDFVFVLAAPIVTRTARPDGLTRKYVAIVGLKYKIQ